MRKLFSLFFLFFAFTVSSKAQEKRVTCSKAIALHTKKNMRSTLSEEALQLMDQYNVHYYKLDVAAERTDIAISGNTTMAATVVHGPLSSFVFELCHDMTIDSIRFNGALMTYTRTDSLVTVSLPAALSNGSLFQSVVYYHGVPSGGVLHGTEPFHDQPVTCSLSEPFNAYHWFAVKQILSDKADSVDVWITTSDDNKAGSNGMLNNTTVLPGNKVRYEWKSSYPIAYYLISFSVAQYMEYTLYAHPAAASQAIPVINYIYDSPEALAYFKTELDKTPDMIETFSDLFGLYPFDQEKYGHCTAPIGGGMEHQTMTTVNDFFTGLTAHELAHQWFGDHVTCASWHDIWLNEGFASYSELIYHQTDLASNAQSWLDNAHGEATSFPSGSVYVDDTTDSGRIFDSRLTYKKGGLLLHMLRFEINDDQLFFQGLKNYQQAFSFRTATAADFKNTMESTTGKDFDAFFNQWYYGSGYPVLSATWNHDPNGSFYLRASQTGSDPSVTPLYKTSLQILLTRSGAADTLIRIFLDQAINGFAFPHVQGTVTGITLDPNQWLIHKVDHIEYDPSLLITATQHMEEAKKITAYPNPTPSNIRLDIPENYTDVAKLYDARGQQLLSIPIEGSSVVIKTDTLSPGLYLIVMQQGRRTLSFIKE